MTMTASTSALFNCGVIINPPNTTFEPDRTGMMNSVPSPSLYSPGSVDSQDSSSNMSALSPMSVTLSPKTYHNILVLGHEPAAAAPYLNIIEQPVEKFRFRYKSEMMGTHGSILGRSSDKTRKRTYPTVELCNYDGPAIIRCSIYTTHPVESQRSPHTHRLVVRADNDDKDDPHELLVSPELGYTAVFQGMGIIHTAKKHITDELIKKKKFRHLEMLRLRNFNITSISTRDEINIRSEADAEAKKMNLNSVCLCFEAFYNDNGLLQPLCDPVFSAPINNMKSALTGELKICRIDKHVSSCLGNEEVFILVEKVGKKNIRIKFFELDDEDNEIWCDYGKFSELDVHHQYAIVFRTPPYRDTEIDKTVEVYLQLYRPTDGDCSEPIRFAYKPSEKMGRARKRQRTSYTDDIPVAIVQGQVYGNPILTQSAGVTSPLDDDLDKIESTDLFERVLNEEGGKGINSSEFKDFINNLSFSSLGSSYVETFDNEGGDICKDIMSTMDLSTDGSASLKKKKKRGEAVLETSVAAKLSRVSLHEQDNRRRKDAFVMDGVQSAKRALARLNELMLERPSQQTLAARVADIFSKKTEDGDGPLHCAILNDMQDLAKQMLTVLGKGQHRKIINDRNKNDETPLHLAVLHNQPETVKKLLNIGANPNYCTVDGDTPLHLAVSLSHDQCTSELLNESNYTCYSCSLDCNLTNYEGCTPLHTAARVRNLFAIRKLVKAKADVNRQDTSHGRNVLHVAVEEGSVDVARFLLEETEIEVNAANYSGNTALHLAVVHAGKGSRELCTLLLQHGADPHKANYVTDREVCINMDIKEEPESEDDDDYELRIADKDSDDDDDEGSTKNRGQTSLDLALNNKDILDLLQKVEREGRGVVKEEPCGSPELEGMLAEGRNNLFDVETLERLCVLLDGSQGWVNLAELLDYRFLVPSFRDSASPSKMLFNYADLHGSVSVQDIRSFLEALDEHEAVEAVDLMLAKRIVAV